MLVDLDCFFVAVERLADPALEGRAVVVGGLPGERGVVACASYEARRHGVRAGMPIFEAVRRLPPREAVFLHGDHAAYLAASQRVMAVLEGFTPAVEPLSLDEALLDFEGLERHHRTWLDAAQALRDAVRDATGLSVSVGVGGTRCVAKVAADLAKPRGILEVVRGEEAAFLSGLPLRRLPGVGPRLLEALERFHLRTIGDLAAVPEEILTQSFGRVGESVSRRARGLEPDLDLPAGERRAPLSHSISRETSFAADTCDPAVIDGMLSYLAQRAAVALREERGLARSVGVRLRYSDFRTVEARRRLREPTDRDDEILEVVRALWPQRYERRVTLRLVGVTLCDVVPASRRQLPLFEARGPSGQGGGTLDATLDRIRQRHGFGAVVRGRAIGLLDTTRADARGFRLRTPACSR
jgi:DNA polymerase-4